MRSGQFILFAVVAFVGGTALRAEDKVEFKGSTSYELPKPSRNVEQGRVYKSERESPNLQGGFVNPSAPQGNALLEKKYKEMMDKKKNWILQNPYEDHYDNKTSEFMKGEKSTGLFNQRWMKGEEDDKSLVEKFLSEKQDRHNQQNKDKDQDKEHTLKNEAKDNREALEAKEEKSEQKSSSDAIVFGKGGKSGPPEPDFIADQKRFEERVQRGPSWERPFGDHRAEMSPGDKEKMRTEQANHDAEFGRFLQSLAPSASSTAARPDPLGSFDFSRPDGNAPGSRRPDPLGNFGAGQGAGAGLAQRGFGGLSANVPSARATPLEDLAPKAQKSAAFSPAMSAVPTPAGSGFTPSPFQLPFPKRNF